MKMGRIRTLTEFHCWSTKAQIAGVAWFLLIVYLQPTTAHVGLTFPPARKFDLDFLDNIRTKPPCGMPKGSIKTSLVTGSTINVTWHLSYPHRGGYRLELMDSQERMLLDLTPKNGDEDYIKGDPTAQAHTVKLPDNFTCDDCTIRLLRQASEWANQYRFWSCSDVDIVPAKKFKETCSGNGRAVVGRCVCNKGFWGARCQYEDECETEAECSNNGKCIDLGGTALPRKQCFCSVGFHGEKCRKRNLVKLPTSSQPLDLSRHTKRVLSDRMTLHYRILPAAKEKDKEIEFILKVKGTSYGAIGWRPAGFKASCKRWPFIDNSTAEVERTGKNSKLQTTSSSSDKSVHAEPESTAEAEAEPETSSGKDKTKHKHKDHAHPEPESASEPVGEPTGEPSSEPEVTAEPETTSEPVAKTTSKPKSGAEKLKSKLRNNRGQEGSDVQVESSQVSVKRVVNKYRQKRSPENPSAEPEPETVPEPETKAEPSAEPEAEAGASEPEPEGSAKAEPESEAEAEPGTSGSSISPSSESKKELKPSVYSPKGDFHAMDCIDMVMGGARGPLSRIRDYYTRDRSTPRVDSFWGGKDDITSATGWEEKEETVLIFRRKLLASDEADHDIAGEMHVIWARGQENGEYVHSPHSGLEKETPTRAEFYAPDEIKYHGHGAQRGITRINFLAEQSSGRKKTKSYDCENGWSHPPGCHNYLESSNPCEYNATWRYIPESDSVKFTIETRKPDRWTGIGFSDTPQMRNSDAVIGWVTTGGAFFHMDTWMASYTAPVLDNSQDIGNMTGKYKDGIIHWSFIRKVKTGDPKDVSLDECRFFLFPVEGGTYNHVNKKIRKHEQLPIASSEKICIPRECRPVRIQKDPELRYEFDIKLTGGLGNNWRPPRKESEDFKHLENRIGTELSSKLKNIKGFKRLSLTDIKRDGKAGALAKLELMVVPNSELAEKSRVERALNDTLESGHVGAFQIDPTYLKLKAPVLEENEYEDDDPRVVTTSAFGGQRLWIVIGCVAALIVLALVQAVLTIYKVSGKTSSHKGSNGSGMAWRDYSVSGTNYGYDAYDEKMGPNAMQLQQTTGHYPPANGHGHGNGGAPYPSTNGNGSYAPPSMSLPRPHHGAGPPNTQSMMRQSAVGNGGGGVVAAGGSNGLNHNPDFYFMPSQRKYSGEMVRVYVDHNKR